MRLVLFGLLLAQSCRAHLPSSSTLALGNAGGTWTVPLAVLDDAWLIDADSDGKISNAEWQVLEESVHREMARSLFAAGTDNLVAVRVTSITAAAPQVIVKFSLEVPPQRLTSRLLASDDPLHRVVRK